MRGYEVRICSDRPGHAGFHSHFEKPAPISLLLQVLQNPNRKPIARQDGVPLNPY